MTRSAPAAPWSVPVRLDEIGQGLTRRVEADAAARERVARSLDLPAVERLEAEFAIKPLPVGGSVKGRLRATVVQTCGVTLEPLTSTIDEDFDLDFTTVEPETNRDPEAEYGLADLDTPDYVAGGTVDLGVWAVEQLSLSIDPFPRKPGATFEPPEQAPEPSPFAALAKLRDAGES